MTDFIHITEKTLDVQEISEKVTESSTGATSLFIGTTRDHFHGKKVLKLEYEAYVPMAKKKLKELCNSLRVKWPELHHIGIYHRLGQVGPCEASVIIGNTDRNPDQNVGKKDKKRMWKKKEEKGIFFPQK